MNKEFFDKHSEELECAFCEFLKKCVEIYDRPLCQCGYTKYLEDKLAHTEKALELAGSYIWEISGREDCPNAFSSEEFDEINKCNCVHDERNINGKCWIELFKYDAKKELEKSKGDEK